MKKKSMVWLYWLVESAIMIALSAVLELVSKSIIPEMTFGGQITIVSMLPVVLVAWKYGIGKGLITGLVYSLVQMAMGVGTISKMILPTSDDYLGSLTNIVLMFVFDYILAYTVLGFSAMYTDFPIYIPHLHDAGYKYYCPDILLIYTVHLIQFH